LLLGPGGDIFDLEESLVKDVMLLLIEDALVIKTKRERYEKPSRIICNMELK
jgi:hypothetical protein